jgi:hypothetical protein
MNTETVSAGYTPSTIDVIRVIFADDEGSGEQLIYITDPG